MKDFLTLKLIKNNRTDYKEINLPVERQDFLNGFLDINVDLNNFTAFIDVGDCPNLNRAISKCKSLSELNYFGFIYSKMSDFQRRSFIHFSDSDFFKKSSIDIFINIMLVLANQTIKYPLGYYSGNPKHIPGNLQINM